MTPEVKSPLMEMNVVCSRGYFVFHCHSKLLTEVYRKSDIQKHLCAECGSFTVLASAGTELGKDRIRTADLN